MIRPPPAATLFAFFDGKDGFDMVFQCHRTESMRVHLTFFRTGIASLLHRTIRKCPAVYTQCAISCEICTLGSTGVSLNLAYALPICVGRTAASRMSLARRRCWDNSASSRYSSGVHAVNPVFTTLLGLQISNFLTHPWSNLNC